MTNEQAREELNGLKNSLIENHLGNDTDMVMIGMAVNALELMSHITDRPCDACEFHDDAGCHKWSCVFDEFVNENIRRLRNDNT